MFTFDQIKAETKNLDNDGTAETTEPFETRLIYTVIDLHKCPVVQHAHGEDSMNFMKTRNLAYGHYPPSRKISKGIASVIRTDHASALLLVADRFEIYLSLAKST